jgi:hypothetical protein
VNEERKPFHLEFNKDEFRVFRDAVSYRLAIEEKASFWNRHIWMRDFLKAILDRLSEFEEQGLATNAHGAICLFDLFLPLSKELQRKLAKKEWTTIQEHDALEKAASIIAKFLVTIRGQCIVEVNNHGPLGPWSNLRDLAIRCQKLPL